MMRTEASARSPRLPRWQWRLPQPRAAAQAAPAQPPPAQTAAQALAQAAPPTPRRPADQGLPAGRPEDARGRAARLPAVPRRLEQAADRARRDRRRQPALPDRAGAGRRRRHRHVQGRRRLHDARRAHRARELPQARRRPGRPARRDLRRRRRAGGRSIMGGAKKHGETNFTLEAPVTYTLPRGRQPDHQGRELASRSPTRRSS